MSKRVKKSNILLGIGTMLMSAAAVSAPGILQDIPLGISTSTQPNILFLLDDSGSMDWEQLISEAAQDAYSVGPNGSASDLNFSPTNNTEINELCLQYNLMAYNPDVEYDPWSGSDDDGNLFSDKTLTTALEDPYITNTPHDLSNHVYMSWVDANTDTVFDIGECGDYATIAATSLTPGGFTVNVMGTDTSSTAAAGYLVDSGNVGGDYGNNQTHGFVIQPTGATQITISFSSFDLESGYDFLRIYSGTSNAGIELAELDGSTLPPSITVNSSSVYVEFDSDFSVVESGFILFWNHSTSGVATPAISSVDFNLCRADDNCTVVADLPTNATAGVGVTNTQENYANWYTYYRKREYVAKKALSDIIDGSEDRLGLATLHNNTNNSSVNVGTIIDDMRVDASKSTLLNSLVNVRSSGGTPLRQNLEHVGRYFMQGENAPNNTTTCPSGDDCVLFGFTPNHSSGDTVSTDSPIFNNTNGGMCQQNFAVVFSDGFWNGSDPSVGDTDNTNNTGQESGFDGGTFADAFAPTLADVAMNYLERDLSSTLPNVNNVTDVRDSSQTITHQHLTTYTVAFGLRGTINLNPNEVGFTGWTDPITNGGAERIDDMRHAAWNGRGEFLSADNPQELIARLEGAVDSISDRVGTATAASFSSGLIESDTLVFQSRFSTINWTGDLLAFEFDENGVVNLDTSSDYVTTINGQVTTVEVIDENDAIWSAATELAADLNTTGYSRNIITYDGSDGVPFEFDQLSSSMQADLLTNRPSSMSVNDYGDAIVDYFKGSNVHEIGVFTDSNNDTVDDDADLFRARDGDYLNALIHSSPQYVGPPSESYPNLIEGSSNPTYSSFVNGTYSNRTPLVFVGGNDGMLHAFDATNSSNGGREIFAYIPGSLSNDLHSITESSYNHLAYVDLTPTIRDVFVNSQWRTYLVGGMRSGGKGIYVLDITSPSALADSSNAASIVVNEFTHDDLGFTYSRPQIARMNNGRWVAIFGNGYNNSPTGDGRAKLFILDLASGAVNVLDTGVGTVVADGLGNTDCQDVASDCNGLSSPAIVDIDGDYNIDRIYAGDLHGNMWVFDVSSNSPTTWESSSSISRLFVAEAASGCSGTSCRQPITTKPRIIRNPGHRSFATSPNLLVYFGTGQFIADGDNLTNVPQSFYAVWDAGSASTSRNLERDDLQAQAFTYNSSTGDIGVSNSPVSYQAGSSGTFGWYIDLSVPTNNVMDGGRVVIDPIVIERSVVFIATVPGGQICNREGNTYLVVLGALDGNSSGNPVTGGPGEGTFVGVQSLTLNDNTKAIATTDADGSIDLGSVPTPDNLSLGRKSWSTIKEK